MLRRHTVASVALSLTFLGACSEPPSSPPDNLNIPISLNVLSGGDQSALEYTQLPQIIVVQILNSRNKPVVGQIVNFRVVQGGGSVFAGAAVTDNKGIAKDWWTVGGAGFRNLLEARAVDPVTGAQLVLGTVLAFPQPLINPQIQFKCANQADWTPPPTTGPGPRECYGPAPDAPRFEKGEVVTIQVRVVHNGTVPVPNMWLDFYADHNTVGGTPPSVTPVYGRTNADGIATLMFTIGSQSVLNSLLVVGPGGIERVQEFRAGY